jgi:hypothetical protein
MARAAGLRDSTGKKRDLILPSFDTSRRNPKRPRRGNGINSPPLPPGDFVAGVVVVSVMGSAKRYGELIADFETHRAGLSKSQVVGVGGASAADETGLRGNEPKMSFVAEPTRLADRKYAFVDFARSGVDLWGR